MHKSNEISTDLTPSVSHTSGILRYWHLLVLLIWSIQRMPGWRRQTYRLMQCNLCAKFQSCWQLSQYSISVMWKPRGDQGHPDTCSFPLISLSKVSLCCNWETGNDLKQSRFCAFWVSTNGHHWFCLINIWPTKPAHYSSRRLTKGFLELMLLRES